MWIVEVKQQGKDVRLTFHKVINSTADDPYNMRKAAWHIKLSNTVRMSSLNVHQVGLVLAKRNLKPKHFWTLTNIYTAVTLLFCIYYKLYIDKLYCEVYL